MFRVSHPAKKYGMIYQPFPLTDTGGVLLLARGKAGDARTLVVKAADAARIDVKDFIFALS
jgi:hypothetical protein